MDASMEHHADVSIDRAASSLTPGAKLRPWQLVAIEFERRHRQPMTRSKAESIGRKALAKLMARMRGVQ